MSEIPIAEYLSFIDQLLENEQLAEAVAHCRHILQQHSRHIDTYRLLGKALLEQEQYSDAVDIFQRVLSADPEDFIAHVGMSIVHKEEEMLPHAIWHMERAYELDPYNAAIQQELRELYRRRDDRAPDKLNLTRGALARLYARGDLYQQAAAEIRQALAEDENRVDLQVLLAEVLWRDERRVEAVETSLDVLDRLPNCIKANAILAEAWMLSGRVKEANAYLGRVQALTLIDRAHLDSESVVGRAFLAKGAVTLPQQTLVERLTYSPVEQPSGEFSLDDTPDWVFELGREQATEADDWLASVSDEMGAPVDDEEVLDWLRDAAGDKRQAETDETAGDPAELPEWLSDLSAEEGAEADETDWLTAVAGSPETEEPAGDEPVAAEMDELDWLTEEEEEVEETAVSPEAGDEPAAAELPDWLATEMDSVQAQGTDWLEDLDQLAEAEFDDARAGLAPADLPDWLTGARDSLEAADLPEDALPDWLTDVDLPAGVAEFTDWEPETEDIDDEVAARSAVGDDAAELEADMMEQADEFEMPDDIPDGDDLDAAMIWLEQLAAQQGAPLDELPSFSQEEAAGHMPVAEEEVVDEAQDPLADVDIPDWLKAETEADAAVDEARAPAGASTDDDRAVETPDWFDDELAPVAEDEETTDALPDWLRDLTATDPALAGEAEAWLEATGGEQDLTADEAPDWLRDMAAEDQGIFDEALSTEEPGEPTEEDDPGWLAELDEAATVDAEDEYELPDWAGEELPDWLMASGDEDEAAAVPADEIPDWLQAPAELPAEGPTSEDDFDEDLSWLDQIAAGQGPVLEEPPTLGWSDATVELERQEPEEPMAAAEDLAEALPDEMPDDPEAARLWLEALAEERGTLDMLTQELPDEAEMFGDVDVAGEPAADLPVAIDDDDFAVPEDLDDALAWLEQLAAQQGAPIEELPTIDQPVDEEAWPEPAADAAELGDWLAGDDELAAMEPVEALAPAEPAIDEESLEDLFDALGAAEPAAEVAGEAVDSEPWDVEDDALDIAYEVDEGMEWLDEMAAGQGAMPDEPVVEETSVPVEATPGGEAEVDLFEAAAEERAAAAALDESPPEDLDEAMAWLEQLAARQGAPLDELPSVDEMPADLEPVDVEMVAPPDAEEPVAVDLLDDLSADMPEDPDEAMAWLDQLAEEGELAEAEMAAAESAVAGLEPEAGDPVPSAEAEWDEDEAIAEERPSAVEFVPDLSGDQLDQMPDDPDAAIAWLEQLAAEEEEAPVAEIEPVEDEPAEEMAGAEPLAEQAEPYDIPGDLSEQDVTDSLPDWLALEPLDEMPSEPIEWPDELDRIEATSWITAEELAAAAAAAGSMPEAEDEAEVETEAAPEFAAKDEPELLPEAEIEAEEAMMAEPEEPEPVAEAPPAGLAEAREALQAGRVDEALALYGEALAIGQDLSGLIMELETAVSRHPRHPLLHRLLGDAYMQNGQLQKALDIYRQVLDQL